MHPLTHARSKSNMPHQLFQSWGHKNREYHFPSAIGEKGSCLCSDRNSLSHEKCVTSLLAISSSKRCLLANDKDWDNDFSDAQRQLIPQSGVGFKRNTKKTLQSFYPSLPARIKKIQIKLISKTLKGTAEKHVT